MPSVRLTPRLVIGVILLVIPFIVFAIGMVWVIFPGGARYYPARQVDTSTWDAGPAPTVTVDLFQGHITVAQAADGRVAATVTRFAVARESQATADAALAAIRVDAVRDGASIRITTSAPPDLKVSELKADLELRVPPDAAVDLQTAEGYISVGKVYDGPYAGHLVESPVALRAVQARDRGQVYLGIDVELVARPALPATTLDLASRRGSVLVRGDNVVIRAEADQGAIQFTGRPAPGVHHLRAGSSGASAVASGQPRPGIQLTLPADTVFEVDARSERGAVSSEFSAEFATPAATPGGIKLELRTGDGPIEIRRAGGGGRKASEPASASIPEPKPQPVPP